MLIYTFGYQGKTPAQLSAALAANRAFLVDIRYQPYSSHKVWNQTHLRQHFGPQYLHIRDLGNVNYKGGPVQIANLHQGVARVLRESNRRGLHPVLMCVCRLQSRCHRSLAAAEFTSRGYATAELEAPPEQYPNPQPSLF